MDKSKVPSLSLPATVQTKLGPIFITPTEANHIHVTSRHDRNEGSGLLTLRGCEYYISAHFYGYEDGTFNIGPEFHEENSRRQGKPVLANQYDRRQSLYISNHAASESARTKLAEVVTEAVTKWVSENPETIAAAHIEYLRNKVESAQSDVHKAKEVLRDAEAELRTAKQNVRTAEQAAR